MTVCFRTDSCVVFVILLTKLKDFLCLSPIESHKSVNHTKGVMLAVMIIQRTFLLVAHLQTNSRININIVFWTSFPVNHKPFSKIVIRLILIFLMMTQNQNNAKLWKRQKLHRVVYKTFGRFADLNYLKRSIAWCLRLINSI